MPDFEIQLSGMQVRPWLDPATLTAPCRLNPKPGRNERRIVATAGTPFIITTIVDGTTARPDDELGGRLFSVFCAEKPSPAYTPNFTNPAGQSSVQSWTPSASYPGHYLLYIRRPQGGSWCMHIDVEAA